MKRVFCIAPCVAGRVFPLGVVFSEAPFANASQVGGYLGRYTHKTAITYHRLVDFDGEQVRFHWRDYAHGNKVKALCLRFPTSRPLLCALAQASLATRQPGSSA